MPLCELVPHPLINGLAQLATRPPLIVSVARDMPDKLVPIPVDRLPELKRLLSADFPRHLVGYGLIANLEEWHKQSPVIDHVHVWSLNGQWEIDGLFLVTVSFLPSFLILPIDSRSPPFRTVATCSSTASLRTIRDSAAPSD